jgi:hypothetical protein
LKNTYKEIPWLLIRIVDQDTIEIIPRFTLYILHFKVHENTIFEWAKIISNEINVQLTSLKTNEKFYMSSYLIFSITYSHAFKGLNISIRVKTKVNHVTMWYQALWRKKFGHHFYEVYNDFVSKFKKLLFREDTSQIS